MLVPLDFLIFAVLPHARRIQKSNRTLLSMKPWDNAIALLLPITTFLSILKANLQESATGNPCKDN